MKIPFLILAILFTYGATAQNDTIPYYFNEIGLFINVPSKFKVISAEESKRIRARGEKAMEEANRVDIDANATTTLISVREGQFNYLDVTITPYKNYTAQGYARDNKLVQDALFKTFVDRVPTTDIDTTNTTVKINGLSFDVFQMKIKLAPAVKLRMFLLGRYYKGYDLGMSYVYVDDAIGKELEDIIKQITFKR